MRKTHRLLKIVTRLSYLCQFEVFFLGSIRCELQDNYWSSQGCPLGDYIVPFQLNVETRGNLQAAFQDAK